MITMTTSAPNTQPQVVQRGMATIPRAPFMVAMTWSEFCRAVYIMTAKTERGDAEIVGAQAQEGQAHQISNQGRHGATHDQGQHEDDGLGHALRQLGQSDAQQGHRDALQHHRWPPTPAAMATATMTIDSSA